jgi:hypothetical protein
LIPLDDLKKVVAGVVTVPKARVKTMQSERPKNDKTEVD